MTTSTQGGAGAEAPGYEGTALHGGREPENRVKVIVDAEGYVVRAELDNEAEPLAFLKVMRKVSMAFIPPEIVLPEGWTIDEETGIATKAVEVEGEVKAVLTSVVVPVASGGVAVATTEESHNPTAQEIAR